MLSGGPSIICRWGRPSRKPCQSQANQDQPGGEKSLEDEHKDWCDEPGVGNNDLCRACYHSDGADTGPKYPASHGETQHDRSAGEKEADRVHTPVVERHHQGSGWSSRVMP